MNKNYTTYEALKGLLIKYRVEFREVEHIDEGRSEKISQIRGNKPEQAAKAMVIDILKKETHQYYLTVLPGSSKVNFEVIRDFFGAEKVSFAKTKIMRKLTSCDSGASSPFSFNENLNVIIDPELYKNEEIVFNAGRLDKSIYILSKDYIKIVKNEYQKRLIFLELSIS